MASPRFEKGTPGYKLFLWSESFFKKYLDCDMTKDADTWTKELFADSAKFLEAFEVNDPMRPLAYAFLSDMTSYLMSKRKDLELYAFEKRGEKNGSTG